MSRGMLVLVLLDEHGNYYLSLSILDSRPSLLLPTGRAGPSLLAGHVPMETE